MGETESKKTKSKSILINVDLTAKVTGFDSATSPTPAHRKTMKNFSSVLIFGPPQSNDLLELMMHMFTDAEADAAQHLPPLIPRTAAQVARRCGRSEQDVAPVLNHLADIKHVILAFGDPRKYTILPLIPGTFELAVMSPDLTRTNSWHKKFAELFERIWGSGYMKDFILSAAPLFRYLPVPGSVPTVQSAWPTDMLEEILAPYNNFGITHCQCRLVMDLSGNGCGKPTENCVAIGPLAQPMIDRGLMRKADKKEVIEKKREAEQNGCVTWMMNGQDSKQGNVSCSCCGCCCHGLRSINELSAPGLISKPHFMPAVANSECNMCGKCERTCPMGAWSAGSSKMKFDSIRCIGCGLCVTACKKNALELKPVPDARQPEKDFNAVLLKNAPSFIANSFKLWVKRAAGI